MEQTITLEVPTNVKSTPIGLEIEYLFYGSMTVHESSTQYVLEKLQNELSSAYGKLVRVKNNQFLIIDTSNNNVSKGLVTIISNSGFDIFW